MPTRKASELSPMGLHFQGFEGYRRGLLWTPFGYGTGTTFLHFPRPLEGPHGPHTLSTNG